ncbi:hypothetical protein DdX_10490 [Ditylenchus destructor]|uniref:Uncharacterized protein n=1 Tax=Ditylenchus destructor TaxID=166010 RepID=A0AAD4N491_9BILA|nr:hypothetical protein DdX_10490 [Ditylenchus destructor]
MKLYISFFAILLVTIGEAQSEDNEPTPNTDLPSTGDFFPDIPGITMINTPADLLTKGSTKPASNGTEVTETATGSNNHTDTTETDGHNFAASTRPFWLQKLIITATTCLAFLAARK